MKSARLGDVAAVNPRGDRVPDDQPISFVGMAELDAERAIATPLSTRAFGDVSKGYTVFRDGDVLAARITPCWENGKIGQADLDHPIGVGSTEFHVIRPTETLNRRYLLHFLRQPYVRATGELRMTGSAGQRRVPAQFLQSLEIPLPPLPEQRRIAAILDHADAVRAKRRQALAHLDSLTQSIFHDMIGDPVTNPKAWPASVLGDEVTSMQYGPRFHNETYSRDGVRIVRITDLDALGRLNFDGMPRLQVSSSDQEKYLLNAGDIVFARTGATVGKLALITPSSPPCIAGAYFIRLRFNTEILPEYAFAALRTENIQAIVWAGSHQSAQQNFSGPGLRALPLPIPPLDLQREFARRIEGVNARRAAIQRSLAADDELFASLQSRAFAGEL